MLNVISLGAGVQSSTMALMATAGEITPMPDGAIFADTMHEPRAVYDWLEWLQPRLPFPVWRVSAGDLVADTLRVRTSKRNGHNYWKNMIPTYSADGMSPRKCTYDYKIIPITRKMRELCRPKRMDPTILARQWIGISLDEAHRMKPSRWRWIQNVFPLVDRRLTRRDCLQWVESHGYPRPPKSACVFCPFHSDAVWKNLKENSPDEFAKAVQFERDMNKLSAISQKASLGEFLHPLRVPLDQVDFGKEPSQMSFFGNECEGLCGV